MTDSLTYPAPGALPPNVQLTFRDENPDPALRQAAEQSVATLVARGAERAAMEHEAETKRAKLANALNAPIKRLLEADPEATKALSDLRTQPLLDPATKELDPDHPLMAGYSLTDLVGRDSFRGAARDASIAVRVPPYDFGWSWYKLDGFPPFTAFVNNATGRVTVEARSGAVASGQPGFVEVHAGFGLFLTTDHPVTAIGRSFRLLEIAYDVGALGPGASAVSEGFLEFTALEDGILKRFALEKIWRKKVSGGLSTEWEKERYEEGPHAWFEPRELAFPMTPGHGYTFNVGVWVFADHSSGVGAGGARSWIGGDISAITIER